MEIREIKKKDNEAVEKLIRVCLIEFGANKPGFAWTDPQLGRFYELYSQPKSKYWVVEDKGEIVAGCGIGPVEGMEDICELQKMYSFKEYRGCGIAKKLLDLAIDYAKENYNKCYLETLSTMVAANKFYIKNGFEKLEKPIIETEHFSCDSWYLKKL
ncbi:MAG: GNAT family N-acetyltransferase [Clostridium sp.]